MQSRRKSDAGAALMAALIAAVAAVMLWETSEFSPFGSIFPRVAGGVLLLGSLFVLGRALLGMGPEAAQRSSSGLLSSVALMVVMLVWILMLEVAGFTLASWVGFVALTLIAGGERPSLRKAALYAVVGLVLVLALQLLFQQVLGVRLPAGELLPALKF
ncbi:MAG: tripartite tricarboxylate transporter TctB family protein [Methylibium sp.]|uniref:tripartite tricarboxylate transporter TctB family protein n=1 Tax=Methylibium sp. TaxID=2067992 RepID=UPI0017B9F263|nr:tripartite tricarboxylate transporter TctB family protein [Methylibium sp.]MBA3598279.1 tripartite tricarboxylate transporter TctB family protein [Methylibium sp.]